MRRARLVFTFLTTIALATLALSSLANGPKILLEGAEVAFIDSRPLMFTIGPDAQLTDFAIESIGGVAFVREATGADGWAVTGLRYDRTQADGQRLTVTLARNGGSATTIQPKIWDWEIIPLARFVASGYDGAFTYFGEPSEGVRPTLPSSRIVSYHPDLKDTLMGLRFLQLDLMLFKSAFAGYITDESKTVILGGGEREAFGADKNPSDQNVIRDERKKIEERIKSARESLGRYSSYIVGDIISPVEFKVSGDRLTFQDKGLCWDFSRRVAPGESPSPGLDDHRLLRALSEEFCRKVRDELSGLHPVVYRAGYRAMRYAALMRHFKKRDPQAFERFVRTLDRVTPDPEVLTPTEIAATRVYWDSP